MDLWLKLAAAQDYATLADIWAVRAAERRRYRRFSEGWAKPTGMFGSRRS